MATKTELPEFNGKPLIEIPKYILTANFLEGDFGRAVLKEYGGRARADYNNNKVLNVLKYKNGVVKGSNPFAVVLINQIIKPGGLRTATPADLEKILKTKALDLGGSYEDSALVLRNEDEPNKYLAKNLAEQIKAKQNKIKIKYPIMIPLAGLELKKDQNSEHGLAFKLREDAEIIYAPILNKPGKFSSEDIDKKTGLPKKTGKGNRTLYTIVDSGLSGLFLDGSLGLNFNAYVLADSHSVGRVVILGGEAASQNFGKYTSQLQKEKAKQQEKLDKKFNEAIAILKG